jgi:nucleotide-binding universal stress UspA family protein
MFEKIVVGYDQSDGSRDALALASEVASKFGSALTVGTTVPAPMGGNFAPALTADAYTNLAEQAAVAAREAAEPLGAGAAVSEASSPAIGLEQIAASEGADLVVIGCAKADPGHVRAGHKARQLMSGGEASVLLAPVGYASGGSIDRVGVAVNGTPESDRAIGAAAAFADGGPVEVISVATDFAEYWGHWTAGTVITDLAEASREAAQAILDDAVAKVPQGTGSEPVLREGDAIMELRAVSEGAIDLLCLGSRSYGPVRRVLLGSTSTGVVGDAGCAVLVVPRTDS